MQLGLLLAMNGSKQRLRAMRFLVLLRLVLHSCYFDVQFVTFSDIPDILLLLNVCFDSVCIYYFFKYLDLFFSSHIFGNMDNESFFQQVGWWSPTIIRGEDREAIHIPNHKFTVNVVRNLTQKTHWRVKTHFAISHLDAIKISVRFLFVTCLFSMEIYLSLEMLLVCVMAEYRC